MWAIYQATGISFERASARNLFVRFEPAPVEEQFKFGTLVFFSGLKHVGVVADERGFYHASRRHGVIYSEFNEYWLKRIDGFRRVPFQLQIAQKYHKEPSTDYTEVIGVICGWLICLFYCLDEGRSRRGGCRRELPRPRQSY